MSDHKPADITSRLDLAATEAAVKEILKDGTPKWVSHPEDFRSMAQEVLAEEKEHSDEMARQFVYRVLAHIGLPQSGAYVWKADE